ncbi:GntR family transcriptional regulator [Erysipelothrix sp. HDW6C]|uniref:GntR family transcriptional regulator n=1 Tax=Erysipelothrix sp. HDW6C TaxID=2714930 RepID=UPI00140A62A7|nr:GntR family transcriptional regulator [Erysipelothrix sp. HDW6C]QIK68980.1 GntR family transcriptional regulator [Erysipelothrix sp. HDW6C]
MDLYIRNNSDKPIYEQIASQLKEKIIAKELRQGELLPSIRLLAKELRISVITTKRVYEELERDGFIVTVPGKGSYVADQKHEVLKESYLSEIQEKLEAILVLARAAKISREEIIEMYDILENEDV